MFFGGQDLSRVNLVRAYFGQKVASQLTVSTREQLEALAKRTVHQDYPAMSLEAFFLNTVQADTNAKPFTIAPFLNEKSPRP